MAVSLPGDYSHHGMIKSEQYNNSNDKLEEPDRSGARWYFSRKEIEENSPSRRDGIDLKKEIYIRKSYCTYLQDLGMRLKVPQVTIATAIVFSHRFFLRQSHAKNDRRTIATVCMFLAGKVEETPRPLKDVILVSYEIVHKKDPSAVQRIKQKEVYEQQKELILLGERVVLATLGFDLNVHHPYKPLVEAIKKFKVAQNALAQVAWNFVNDGLRTSLCLQFKPHHIAAGAIFLAAKFLKVKLPSDGEKVWWQEFDVTPRQLEDVSNQMLELYEQNRTGPSSHPSEVEGSTGGATNQPVKTNSTVSESSVSVSGPAQDAGVGSVKQGRQALPPASLGPQSSQKKINDNVSADTKRVVWDHSVDSGVKNCSHNEVKIVFGSGEKNEEASSSSKSTLDGSFGDEVMNEKAKNLEADDRKDEGLLGKFSNAGGRNLKYGEAARGYCIPDAITKIDKDKVKAAIEKRRKLRNDVAKKNDIVDEDDLIERELENGIELPLEVEKIKQEKRAAWPKSLNRQEADSQCRGQADTKDLRNAGVSEQLISCGRTKPKSVSSEDKVHLHRGLEPELDNVEEGELSSLDELPSPILQGDSGKALNMIYPSREAYGTGQLDGVRRRRNGDDYEFCHLNTVASKAMSVGRQLEGLHQYENSDPPREANGMGSLDYTERDCKRHRFESHG